MSSSKVSEYESDVEELDEEDEDVEEEEDEEEEVEDELLEELLEGESAVKVLRVGKEVYPEVS